MQISELFLHIHIQLTWFIPTYSQPPLLSQVGNKIATLLFCQGQDQEQGQDQGQEAGAGTGGRDRDRDRDRGGDRGGDRRQGTGGRDRGGGGDRGRDRDRGREMIVLFSRFWS